MKRGKYLAVVLILILSVGIVYSFNITKKEKVILKIMEGKRADVRARYSELKALKDNKLLTGEHEIKPAVALAVCRAFFHATWGKMFCVARA